MVYGPLAQHLVALQRCSGRAAALFVSPPPPEVVREKVLLEIIPESVRKSGLSRTKNERAIPKGHEKNKPVRRARPPLVNIFQVRIHNAQAAVWLGA